MSNYLIAQLTELPPHLGGMCLSSSTGKIVLV